MSQSALQERLLCVMDQKDHVAWPHFTRPGLTPAQLLCHFRHEYWTYVRDFPVLLARVLGQGPPEPVRCALAENIFEEQTGKLSLGEPHPSLFLEMIDGLGLDRHELERADPPLEAEALAYRAFLDQVSAAPPWVVGAAVLTIFVEGSVHERAEVQGTRVERPIEEVVATHPMVVHYGCPPEKLRLARAHRMVEGGHRRDAWASVLDHVHDERASGEVALAVERALELWRSYRDGVARAMGLTHTGPR